MTGWIILGVTVAGLLGLGGYGLGRWLWGRKRWAWPEGTRETGQYADTACVMIVSRGVHVGSQLEQLADLCALAGHCVRVIAHAPIPRFAVHLTTDAEYDRLYGKDSNGCLRELRRKVGDGTMPLIAISESSFASTPITGSLVVHELCHYLVDRGEHEPDRWDLDHSRRDYFGEHNDSIEARARQLFVALRDEVAEPN